MPEQPLLPKNAVSKYAVTVGGCEGVPETVAAVGVRVEVGERVAETVGVGVEVGEIVTESVDVADTGASLPHVV